MTRLSTWYLRILLERGQIRSEDLPEALSKRVDLYRLTDLWDGKSDATDGSADARWRSTADQIAGWIRATPLAETDRLELRVLESLEPTLEKRLPKDVGPPPQRPFGCWTYELGWPGLADRPGLLGRLSNWTHTSALLRKSIGLPPSPSQDCVLHIMNVLVPRSPFDDLPELARSLHALITQVRSEQPQVRQLWCNTWLNDHPKFHELFSEEWFRNGVVAPPGNYRNWWGQFARRDGDFNEVAAQKFRDAGGVFPFRALLCHAGLDAIDTHLARRFRS